MRLDERRALQSILTCRTEAMGGHRYRCEHCDREHFAWHSCNHRLCPRCGSDATREWVADQLENRLPVDHYMLTFTLPSQLRGLCRYQAKNFLKLFFSCSAQAIKDVLKKPRHLGGECGFIGMLQTWTQDLRLHPHIHYIVPAIGIDSKGRIKRPKRKDWLARGEVFAARLRTLLLKEIEKEGLMSSNRLRELWRIGWNCDVENFGSGENALKYVGGYVCKGPMSDSRMLGASSDAVRIATRNRKTGELVPVEIDGVEFVRRYLQHALPGGFHRIRYYGLLHPRAKEKLASIRLQLGLRMKAKEARPEPREAAPPLCPRCRKPMELTGQYSRAPPWGRAIPGIWLRKQKAAA